MRYRPNRKIMIIIAIIIIILLLLLLLLRILGIIGPNAKYRKDYLEVGSGKDISPGTISLLQYTYSSSTNPPDYHRYCYYFEDGYYLFYYEKREGNHWPLTEDDITVACVKELSSEQWEYFLSLVDGGRVQKKEDESVESGDAGPWMYLRWKGDRTRFQKFEFRDYASRASFERMSEGLSEGMDSVDVPQGLF
jgi:hypothetical protein